MNIPEIVLQRAAELRAKEETPYRQLAQQLLGDAARDKELRSALDTYIKRKSFVIPETDDILPDPHVMHIPDVLTFDYEPALLIADLHAPFTHMRLLREAVERAKQHNIFTCIVAGDVFDANSLSAYKKPWEPVTSIGTDLAHGYQTLRYLTKIFRRVIVLTGNHDEWVMNAYGITAAELFNIPGVIATQHPFIFYENYVIGHPDQYSAVPGEIAAKIAGKYTAHTFTGHDHMAGIVHGAFNGVSIGSMLDAEQIYYKKTSFNALPEWSNGYVIFDKDGYVNCFKLHGKTGGNELIVRSYARFI